MTHTNTYKYIQVHTQLNTKKIKRKQTTHCKVCINMQENEFCTLTNTNEHFSIPKTKHWYDNENLYNWQGLRKPGGSFGEIRTLNGKKHYCYDGFCFSCETKFGKSVLELYQESESIEGYNEKSLDTFFTYLKPLLFDMEFNDNDVGTEPTWQGRVLDIQKEFYRTLRQVNPKYDETLDKILKTIEANKNKK